MMGPNLRNCKFSEDTPGQQVESDDEIAYVSGGDQPQAEGDAQQVETQLALAALPQTIDSDSEDESDNEQEGNPEMNDGKSDKIDISILRGIQALPDLLIGITEILQQTRSEIKDLKIHKEEISKITKHGQNEQISILRNINKSIENTQQGQTDQCRLMTTMIDNQKRLTSMLENQNRLFTDLDKAIGKLMTCQVRQSQSTSQSLTSLEKTVKSSANVTSTLVAKIDEIMMSSMTSCAAEAPAVTLPTAVYVDQTPQSKLSSPTLVCKWRTDKNGSESDSESSDAEVKSAASTTSRTSTSSYSKGHRRPKIPNYKGSELWEIWINRFSDIAKGQGWSEDEKLDEVLLRLQGDAGEFVYGQLSEEVRSVYPKLITELTSRFQKVETPKTYGKK
jgi:hypothetical protein